MGSWFNRSSQKFSLLPSIFFLKDVPKFLPIPRVDFGLQSLEILLKAIHNGSWGGDQLLPPLINNILEVSVFHLEVFKMKRFSHRREIPIPRKENGPLVRASYWEIISHNLPHVLHDLLRHQEAI